MPAKREPTDKITEAVVEALRNGLSMALAATHGGIALNTLARWIRRGVDNEPPYADFVRQLGLARTELAMEQGSNLRRAARSGDVQASIRLLRAIDRRYSDRPEEKTLQAPDGMEALAAYAMDDDLAVDAVAADPRVIAAVLAAEATRAKITKGRGNSALQVAMESGVMPEADPDGEGTEG